MDTIPHEKDSNFSNTLVNELLDKCEVSNLPMVYSKYLESHNGVCTFHKLLSFNSYFTEENICRDLKKTDSIMTISIFANVLDIIGSDEIKQNSASKTDKATIFEPINCVVSKDGLVRVINLYRKLGILEKYVSLSDVENKFCIRSEHCEKFRKILRSCIENRDIFVVLEDDLETKQIFLKFTGRFFHPTNSKLRFQLIVTIAIGLISIIALFFIISRSMNISM